MVRSVANTVEQYLAELPDDRRAEVEIVRDMVSANLPEGYVETMRWGMITYEVPRDIYPDTYNGQPLMFLALAAQKRHLALYLTNVAFVPGGEERFRARSRRPARSSIWESHASGSRRLTISRPTSSRKPSALRLLTSSSKATKRQLRAAS